MGNKTAGLHLFRHLLRAASYLPDEFARSYIHNQIIRCFRRDSKINSKVTPDKLIRRLKEGRRSLSILRRAGDGHIKPLTFVLLRAYGRIGRRRRELVTDLLRAEKGLGPENGNTTDSVVGQVTYSNGSWNSQRPLLDKLVRTQAAHHLPDSTRSKIRHFEPEFPKSIWGRPALPLKRQRNIVRKFWADLLDKILPPLPEPEWKRLRDLVTGVIPFKGPPRRRSPPLENRKPDEASALPLNHYLGLPIRAAFRPRKDAQVQARNNHKITARLMRRIWANVWGQSPMVSYNTETKEWSVVWGGSPEVSNHIKVSAGRSDLELFEEMDQRDKEPMLVRRVIEEVVGPAKIDNAVGKYR